MPSIEWTDDLSVRVARGETVVSLVDYLLDVERNAIPRAARLEVLTERFALSYDDARLSFDRVVGGGVRASNAADEPDRVKDPIAWVSYRRHRGEPVPVEATEVPDDVEREARRLFDESADETGSARGTTSVPVALRLVELTSDERARGDDDGRTWRAALQSAVAVSRSAEAIVDELGEITCAQRGTQAWVDGIRLGACARRLASFFVELDSPDMARRAFQLQGRIATRLNGQCRASVGRAMLDSVAWALREGRRDEARTFCESVVVDFESVVVEWEATNDAPFDEHRLALGYLRAALEHLVDDEGVAVDRRDSHRFLLGRCSSVLARGVGT